MKLCNGIYKITGVEYETNSNIYAIQYKEGIVLIDAGYQEEQFDRMKAAMALDGLDINDVTKVFITHSHFDHAGNVWRFNALNIPVLTSSIDASKIENGNPEMEELFGSKWICGKVDQIIQDGDIFPLDSNTSIRVLETPGHSAGSLSFVIESHGIKAIATSDMFFLVPCPPNDQDGIELGYMGSQDFSLDDLIASLEKVYLEAPDMILPGHYYTYYGDNASKLCHMAYEKALELKKG